MESMTLDQFRQAKESGVDLYAEPQEVQEDAAPEEIVEEPHQEDVEAPDEPVEDDGEESSDDVPQGQQNAFYKRVQRERKKAYEEAEEKLKKEFESQLDPYKSFFEKIGIDPSSALDYLEQNRIQQEQRSKVALEARQLADHYDWDEQQTEQYINEQTQIRVRQQQQDQEIHNLRVQVQINDLSDNPDYPGIKQMKGAITDFIRSNPRTTVEQAYWAVGGSSLAQQLKREAEQREVAKRQKTTRTVMSDTPASMDGPAQLPPEAVEFMRQSGMSEAEVRLLLDDKGPKNLEEYRKMRRK